MVSASRAKKIGQRIQEELAELLQKEAADPRLTKVTVTDVDVDRELAFATVFVSSLDGQDRKDDVLQALHRARGFLRTALAARIPLRTFPQLRFRWDATPARGERIEELLREIHRQDDTAEGEV
jgi:ribosome-binding factor A